MSKNSVIQTIFTPLAIQKIFNSGFSIIYSKTILDPKLKYQLDIIVESDKFTDEICFIGLLPDNTKDSKLMSEMNLAFNNVDMPSKIIETTKAAATQPA